MNCHEATALIAAHADGELDRLQRHAVEKHLLACVTCAQAHQDIRDLGTRIRSEVTYYKAPDALRARVTPPAPAPARPARWRWLAAGALGGCAATVLAWLVATSVIERRALDDLAVEAVNAHVRATLAQHVIEVASSDQHTVKPWLSARLDYSPPVPRVDASGFVLAGAHARLGPASVARLQRRACDGGQHGLTGGLGRERRSAAGLRAHTCGDGKRAVAAPTRCHARDTGLKHPVRRLGRRLRAASPWTIRTHRRPPHSRRLHRRRARSFCCSACRARARPGSARSSTVTRTRSTATSRMHSAC